MTTEFLMRMNMLNSEMYPWLCYPRDWVKNMQDLIYAIWLTVIYIFAFHQFK